MEKKSTKKKNKTFSMSTNQNSSKPVDDSRNRSPHLPNVPKSPAPTVLNSGKQTESSSDDDESEPENFSEIELNAIKAADTKIENDKIASLR